MICVLEPGLEPHAATRLHSPDNKSISNDTADIHAIMFALLLGQSLVIIVFILSPATIPDPLQANGVLPLKYTQSVGSDISQGVQAIGLTVGCAALLGS